MQIKLLGNTSVDFDVLDQRMIRFPVSGRCWRIKGSAVLQYISFLFFFQENLRLS
jgi:hypothetical protein